MGKDEVPESAQDPVIIPGSFSHPGVRDRKGIPGEKRLEPGCLNDLRTPVGVLTVFVDSKKLMIRAKGQKSSKDSL